MKCEKASRPRDIMLQPFPCRLLLLFSMRTAHPRIQLRNYHHPQVLPQRIDAVSILLIVRYFLAILPTFHEERFFSIWLLALNVIWVPASEAPMRSVYYLNIQFTRPLRNLSLSPKAFCETTTESPTEALWVFSFAVRTDLTVSAFISQLMSITFVEPP